MKCVHCVFPPGEHRPQSAAEAWAGQESTAAAVPVAVASPCVTRRRVSCHRVRACEAAQPGARTTVICVCVERKKERKKQGHANAPTPENPVSNRGRNPKVRPQRPHGRRPPPPPSTLDLSHTPTRLSGARTVGGRAAIADVATPLARTPSRGGGDRPDGAVPEVHRGRARGAGGAGRAGGFHLSSFIT